MWAVYILQNILGNIQDGISHSIIRRGSSFENDKPSYTDSFSEDFVEDSKYTVKSAPHAIH